MAIEKKKINIPFCFLDLKDEKLKNRILPGSPCE
jgi:hypothetical protein